MVHFIEGQWVWMPHPTEAWLPVQMISQSATTLTVKSAQDEHFTLPISAVPSLQTVHPSSLSLSTAQSIDNLTDLEELSEGAILHNLRTRYAANAIYTNISSILLSINPYKILPYYGPSTIQHYHQTLTKHLPVSPHIYSLAHAAYSQLCSTNGHPQSIIIAGESGAGKTESTKLVLQYLADVSGAGDDIEQQILEANPIIESFGNARTLKNNNSSRFGKWLTILFNDKHKIKGSKIYSYLLEKSRVVTQSKGESNFHIFYALCMGCNEDEKKRYHLLPIEQYKILGAQTHTDDHSHTSSIHIEIPLMEVKHAMNVLHFTPSQQDCIFRVLAAILHLGNLTFVDAATPASNNNGAGTGKKAGGVGGVHIANENVLFIIAELLSLDPQLLRKSLCTRRLLVGGEVITQLHSIEQCIEMQQALCKSFYDAVFDFLIDHINQTLQPTTTTTSTAGTTTTATTATSTSTGNWIGVLDIFGFENFPINYWEQLCINYTNEKLQQHFIQICLTLDQAEYKREDIRIHWPGGPAGNATAPAQAGATIVDFPDNQPCLDLIEQKRLGIFDMISEEIKLPKGNDMNLLNRMHTAYDNGSSANNTATTTGSAANNNKKIIVPQPAFAYYSKPKTNTPSFTIKHYAGDVSYQIGGFCEKNKGDTLSEDVYEALDSSRDEFMKDLLYWGKKEMAVPTTTSGNSSHTTINTHSNSLQQITEIQRGHSKSSSAAVLEAYPVVPHSPSSPNSSHSPGHSSHSSHSPVPRKASAGQSTPTIRSTSRNQTPTLGAEFRAQLSDLMATLNATQPHFLKCLKPNAEKIADYFDGTFISRQLTYLGIKEVIEVRKSGYPVRLKREEFIQRYRLLLESSYIQLRLTTALKSLDVEQQKQLIQHFMTHSPTITQDTWVLGKTKIFMKTHIQSLLEQQRENKLSQLIIHLQSRYRCKLLRRKYAVKKQWYRQLQQVVTKSKQTTGILIQQLSELDEIISRATDLDLPDLLVNIAKTYRHRVYDAQACQRALGASVQSKERAIIQSALTQAATLQLETCPELIQARDWITANDQYYKDVKSAIQTRNLELLKKCVLYASSMSLDTDLERQALTLQSQLQEEQLLIQKLSTVLAQPAASIDLSVLTSLLTESDRLHLQTPLIQQARTQQEALTLAQKQREAALAEKLSLQQKKVAAWQSRLKLAIETRNTSVLSVLLSMVEEEEYVEMRADMETHPLYTEARSLKQTLDAFQHDLQQVVASPTIAQIQTILARAVSLQVDKWESVQQVRDALKELERTAELKAMAQTALTTRQENILTSVIERIEKRQAAPGGKIDAEEQKLLLQAKAVLIEIQSEKELHEQDVAAIQPTKSAQTEQDKKAAAAAVSNNKAAPPVQNKKGKKETQPDTQTLSTQNNNNSRTTSPAPSSTKTAASPSTAVLRPHAPFYSAPFLSPSLSLHLCPLLRSPDDFVKGKWMGKDKLKKGMLLHSKEALPRSLTQLDGIECVPSTTHTTDSAAAPLTVNDLSINVFKNIQGWMGDRIYSFPDSLAYDILTMGVNQPALRDEIYIQCMKQIRENNKLDSVVRGWQLMGLLSECFLPTPVCLPYLYHFLLTTASRQDALLLGYINYTLHTLHHSTPTEQAPSLTHITGFRDRLMHTLILPLSFPDGSSMDIEVSPEYNCGVIIKKVRRWLGLNQSASTYASSSGNAEDDYDDYEDTDGLSLYMCGPGTTELCLSDDECLLDFPASQCQDGSMYFVLKKRMFTPLTTDVTTMHPIILSMLYHQCVLDACHGVYDLHRNELIEILALHRRLYQQQFFTPIGKETDAMMNIQHIKPLVFQYWDNAAIAKFEHEIEQLYLAQQKAGNLSPHPSAVYDILKKRKEFAGQLFLCSQEERTELPHSLLLAINTYGICLINETTKKLISAFKYAHITGWASNSARFCLRVLVSKGKTVQLNFKTAQGKRIVKCIQEYVDFLLKEQQRKNKLQGIASDNAGSNSAAPQNKKKEAEEEKENYGQENMGGIRTETTITVL